jgi:predicted naringenin-chalcone synthase
VLPAHRYQQREITDALAAMCPPGAGARRRDRGVLDRLHATAGVRTRHLALPPTPAPSAPAPSAPAAAGAAAPCSTC